MKKLLTILMLAIASVTFAADKTTAVFTLDHQMHEQCKVKINTNLRFEKGVSKIDVSLPKNTITIEYNPTKTNVKTLIEAFKKIGFNATQIEPQPKENKETVAK